MAHIPDGVLSTPVLAGGAALAALGVAVALRRLEPDRLPQTALLAAAFFVASLVHVPVGPTSVHPMLNGLMGLVLGSAAVPAILVGLILQLVFFGFGGITTLGVNTVDIGLPAILVAMSLGPLLRRSPSPRVAFFADAAAGALATVLTAGLVCLALALSGPEYVPALGLVLASYGPLALIEAALGGAAVGFLRQVKPELLGVAGA